MKSGIYTFIGGFLGGVLWHSLFNLGFSFSLFVLFLGGITLFFSFFSKDRRLIIVAVILISSFGVGLVRFDLALYYDSDKLFDEMVEKGVVAEGIVIDEPDVREKNTNYTIRLLKIEDREVSENLRVIGESYPAFLYGDRVHLAGVLTKPDGFKTDTGRYFDYASYLSKDDIFYEMIFPKITFISDGEGNIVKRYLFVFKNRFLSRVQTLIPDPEASLLGGLVVGAKQSLGEKLQKDFRTTGIIHIVVLSGYNITIVADAIMRVFSFLPRVIGMSLGVFSIVLFAIMTGASATIVRASIMALLVIVARATGRVYDMLYALFIAGFFMVLHNPKILLYDASFQLSFLATLGLILLAPIVERYLSFIPTRFQLREFATATIATQIFVLPLLLYKMGQLSLVSLPVNLLVLITVPLTMLFGFMSGIIGFVSTLLATPFAFIAHLFLSYQLFVVDFFARLPFASVHISLFPVWLMLLFYVLYGVVLWKVYKRNTLL